MQNDYLVTRTHTNTKKRQGLTVAALLYARRYDYVQMAIRIQL